MENFNYLMLRSEIIAIKEEKWNISCESRLKFLENGLI